MFGTLRRSNDIPKSESYLLVLDTEWLGNVFLEHGVHNTTPMLSMVGSPS